MNVGNLPGEILYRANANRVRYYRAKLDRGFAFTVWSWPYRIVVINDDFLALSRPDIIRFVLAHELGHIVLGHSFARWISVVTGMALFPSVRRWLGRNEGDADEYAEQLSGVQRTALWGESK